MDRPGEEKKGACKALWKEGYREEKEIVEMEEGE